MNGTTSGHSHELHNLHDLAGISTPRGPIRPGRLFRSANPDNLSPSGWHELHEYGIRTVVDLRNDYELADATHRPEHLTILRRPIEDQSDSAFMAVWGDRLGSPEYYPEVLRLWPELVSSAVAAVADAPPGGVLMHCMAGRDRTGMMTAILLELVGVDREGIFADFARSVREINEWWRIHGGPNGSQTDDELAVFLAEAKLTMNAFLDVLDGRNYLLHAGVTPRQLERIVSRLVDA